MPLRHAEPFFPVEQYRSVTVAPWHDNDDNEHNKKAPRQARQWMNCALPSMNE
jgi:hypothetical protein